MGERAYFVYILSSRSRVLYVGVTSDLFRRVLEHRKQLEDGFTRRYQVYRLVYCERYSAVSAAIAREKQLKGWNRAKKIALVEKDNAVWADLIEDKLGRRPRSSRE
jgi:putative endonuclease